MPITNLFSSYHFPIGATDLPVLIVMHGYSSAAYTNTTMLQRMAARGLFVAGVGMRGRNSASGSQDSSGRELWDIYDALTHIRATYGQVSQTEAGIAGYSGGGGNCFGMAARFPDTFSVVASHFGMSDYGHQAPPDGWSGTNTTWVGGTRAAVPDAYHARFFVDAVAENYTGGHLFMYHDEGDVTVPVVHTEQVTAALVAAGRSNYTESITTASDSPRWSHGNPIVGDSGEPCIATEDEWAAALAAETYSSWTVPTTGTMIVPGYLKTKRFEIWLGTTTQAGSGGGLDEYATVTYDTGAGTYTVTPETGPLDVFVKQAGMTATASGISTATELTVA